VTEVIAEAPKVVMPMREERIPMPDSDTLTSEQLHIVETLNNGPRRGVVGPFIPLIQSPHLLNLIEPLGTELRFHGRLEERVREVVICTVAKYTRNQFEWTAHVPLAIKAGVSRNSLSAVLEARIPAECPEDERIALEFAQHLMCSHHVPDSLYAEAKTRFGNEVIVELTTLIGYFVTVCWIMNVAQTKSDNESVFGHVGA
jgi:4-carboxymuconolactone decarboxylase